MLMWTVIGVVGGRAKLSEALSGSVGTAELEIDVPFNESSKEYSADIRRLGSGARRRDAELSE